MNLDENQEKIVKYLDDLMVIAPAGSGKTLCIINKVEYLLKLGIKEEEILIISFTNEIVNDLKKKINKNIDILTFHKLAINILNENKIPYHLCNESLLKYIIDEYFISIISKEYLLKLCLFFFSLDYHSLINSKSFHSFKKTIYTFIKLMQSNNKDLNYFKNLLNNKDKFLIKIIIQIYHIYNVEKKSQNIFDLDDLLIEAKKHINDNLKYKYIFIDEFQDTSLIRFNLIYEIYLHNNAFLYLFGDDFQSIYHFTGCDLNIMLDIKKYLPKIKIFYLKITYRNSFELIEIANRFILKNQKQIRKETTSYKHLNKPIEIIYYTNPHKAFKKLLSKIDNPLVLGRNNFDIKTFDDNNYYNYKYLTIHKAKGLESDNVIILNLKNDLYGIPSQLNNNRLLNYVSKIDEGILYAEERRLFYVALTRSKNKVYLLVPYHNQSIFIKEIKKEINV